VDVEPGGSVINRAVSSIEREQAQRFADILRRELGDMRRAVAIAERKRSGRQRYNCKDEPPERITRLLDRIEEADRILSALTARFTLA
jgi:hypothetical protein